MTTEYPTHTATANSKYYDALVDKDSDDAPFDYQYELYSAAVTVGFVTRDSDDLPDTLTTDSNITDSVSNTKHDQTIRFIHKLCALEIIEEEGIGQDGDKKALNERAFRRLQKYAHEGEVIIWEATDAGENIDYNRLLATLKEGNWDIHAPNHDEK